MQKIIQTPCVLSRERFVTLYKKDAQFEANHDFAQFAGEDEDYIDPDIVQQDLGKLEKLGTAVEYLADRRIAHYDKRSIVRQAPSFGELDACIDFLAELTEKYWLLFKSVDIRNDWVPTPVEDHWEEIFRQPWIPPDTPDKSIDSDPLGMY